MVLKAIESKMATISLTSTESDVIDIRALIGALSALLPVHTHRLNGTGEP